jgi:hypothetical protein
LTADDVDWCRGRAPVIAVNDAYRLAPWADVLYACDAKWWAAHDGVMAFGGEKYGLQHQANHWGVTVLQQTGHEGIETAPSGVRTGRNSTYQAMNVAVHLGARRILLLGCDMAQWPGQPTHFFGEHPRKLKVAPPFALFHQYFDSMVEPLRALGVAVVNCSRRTALTSFPCQPLREALP